jgi:hypothetical protein
MKPFRNLRYFLRRFEFLRVYDSPFKRPKLHFYQGPVALGTPYFLPRRTVRATPKRASAAALEEMKRNEEFNSRNPQYTRTIRPYPIIFKEKMRCMFFEPKRIGFDFVSLGWKTKWTDQDYRFEWAPRWSFVFFGKQIAITFVAPEQHHYWECWLYYNYQTNRLDPISIRLEQCRKEFPCIWTSHREGKEETVCYWDLILKPEYLN